MRSLSKRIAHLERRNARRDKRSYIAYPPDDDGMITVHGDGERFTLPADGFDQWADQQPDSVMIVRVVYADDGLAGRFRTSDKK